MSRNSLKKQWASVAEAHQKISEKGLWCAGEDSNLHALRRYHLKVVRLPVSPPAQISLYS